MKHSRLWVSKFDDLYTHLCGSIEYCANEKSCCTTNTSKVTCKQCLKTLEKEIKMAKAKKVTAKKKTSKKK